MDSTKWWQIFCHHDIAISICVMVCICVRHIIKKQWLCILIVEWLWNVSWIWWSIIVCWIFNLTDGQFGDISTLVLSEDHVVFLFGGNWFLNLLSFAMKITAKDRFILVFKRCMMDVNILRYLLEFHDIINLGIN